MWSWLEKLEAILEAASHFFVAAKPAMDAGLEIAGAIDKDPKAQAAIAITKASIAAANTLVTQHESGNWDTAALATAARSVKDAVETHGATVYQNAAPSGTQAQQ